jgi:DNA gyrase subunit B
MRDEIQVLTEIEAIRQNPGMYIGSVCELGAHHLLNEIVHNSLDEAILGHCDEIQVTVGENFCEVSDNGRGVPTEVHSREKISSCEIALTRLHAGSKFDKVPGDYTAGLHGVGLSCVNALSANLEIVVDRQGQRFEQSYVRGTALAPLKMTGQTLARGTKIKFTPDTEIFKTFSGFDQRLCREFLEDLTYIQSGLQVTFNDLRSGSSEIFRCDREGLRALLNKYIGQHRSLLAEPMRISLEIEGFKLEALVNWTPENFKHTKSFVNGIDTVNGGTHVNALTAGLLAAFNQATAEVNEVEEIGEGMLAVLNCKVAQPRFEGQTKSRLTNTEFIADIERAAREQALRFFTANPQAAGMLFERIRESRNARTAARRAADRIYFQHARKDIDEEVYKEQFGARSHTWHDSAVWITDRQLLQSHADMFKLDSESVALDVCCGSGVVGASFKGKVKKVIGLDLTPEMVKLASQRLDEVVQGNVYNIPFGANSFDLVCTREVLHLLPYPEKPVSEIFRVLKPGGQFIVGQILPFGEADAAWMYRVFKKKQPLIYNMFQEEDFRRMLTSAGFVDLEMREINVWESIDVWIDSFETTAIHRFEIRELFRNAPAEAKAIHPFKILPNGEIQDLWRWCVFSVRKPK